MDWPFFYPSIPRVQVSIRQLNFCNSFLTGLHASILILLLSISPTIAPEFFNCKLLLKTISISLRVTCRVLILTFKTLYQTGPSPVLCPHLLFSLLDLLTSGPLPTHDLFFLPPNTHTHNSKLPPWRREHYFQIGNLVRILLIMKVPGNWLKNCLFFLVCHVFLFRNSKDYRKHHNSIFSSGLSISQDISPIIHNTKELKCYLINPFRK